MHALHVKLILFDPISANCHSASLPLKTCLWAFCLMLAFSDSLGRAPDTINQIVCIFTLKLSFAELMLLFLVSLTPHSYIFI